MNEDMARLALPLFTSAAETPDDFDTVADIMSAVLHGRGVVWGLPENALFAQRMIAADGAYYMRLGPAVGDLAAILALEGEICMWAQSAACRWLQVEFSREGWVRALAPYGYALCDGVLRKNLVMH